MSVHISGLYTYMWLQSLLKIFSIREWDLFAWAGASLDAAFSLQLVIVIDGSLFSLVMSWRKSQVLMAWISSFFS